MSIGMLVLAVMAIDANDSRATTIHNRCQKGDLASVQAILKAFPEKLNTRDNYGHTPLHRAVYSQSERLIQYLIDQGANLEAKDYSGLTPLERSIRYPRSSRLLIKNGANKTIFVHVALGELDEVEDFIKKAPRNIKIVDGLNRSLTAWAALHGQEPVLLALLKRGANANSPDRPLVWGVGAGNTGCVRLLLKYGADPKARSERHSRDAISMAIHNRNDELVKMLVPAKLTKADVEAFVDHLIYASRLGSSETVSFLISRGVDPSSRGSHPYTAIHVSSMFGHVAVVKVLLDAGVDVNARDIGGFTALDYLIAPPSYAGCRKVVFPEETRNALNERGAVRLEN